MEPIAYIHSDFKDKFGIPRQSGIADMLEAEIIFLPKYRQPEAFRGLEQFSHIWILWQFDKALRSNWSATVKPPKLGGKTRMGVFATRSPFRPNPIGLSCVKLESIEYHPIKGTILHVTGADLLDHTPIYDIKPYLPYTDSHPEATGGFTETIPPANLEIIFPEELTGILPLKKQDALIQILKEDPRPGFQQGDCDDYALRFAGFDIHFRIQDKKLTVTDILPDENP